jgi:TonB family protein
VPALRGARALLLALAALSGAPCWAQPLQGPVSAQTFSVPEARPLDNPQQLDEALEELRRAAWRLHTYPGFASLTDVRGHTAAVDVDTFFLTPAHGAQLESLRAHVRDAAQHGDDASLRKSLSAAAPLIEVERERAAFIGAYWTLEAMLAHHVELLAQLEEAASPPERATAQDDVERAARALAADYGAALSADLAPPPATAAQLNAESHALFKVYNSARGKLAAALSEDERARGREPPARERVGDCPAAATTTSGSGQPALAPGNGSLEAVYPQEERHYSLEGVVVLLASVSASGCAQQVQVYESSGVPALDAAAARWAEQASYRPAQREHQAVDGTLKFRVRFSLHDEG